MIAPGTVIDIECFVPVLLTLLSNAMTRSGSTIYRRMFGIGIVQFRILVMLAIEPDISGARLTRIIDLDKGAVSRALKSLQAHGLVVLGSGPGRQRIAALTERGQEVHDRSLAISLERGRRLLAGLSAEEEAVLVGLMKRMLARLPDVEALNDELGSDGGR